MVRRRSFLLPLLLLVPTAGCKVPPKAPADLDGLTLFLYREWENSDPSAMESGVVQLQTFLTPLAANGQLTGDINGRSWQPDPPQKSDLTGITPPSGANPQNCIGASVAFKSSEPIADHARLQIQTNQLPAEPTAVTYTRTFPGNAMPQCFLDQSCLVLAASDDVTRKNPLGSVALTPLLKSFRWVRFPTPNGNGWAIVARSWTERVFSGSPAGAAILQSYSLDVWLSISATETWRYQAVFSQSTPALLPSIMVPLVAQGIDENLQAGDSAIKQLFPSSG
jgi:hypothetical protein